MLPARRRLAVSFVVGVIVGGGASAVAAAEVDVLIGWSAAAATFIVLAWLAIFNADPDRTRRIAQREDESRVTADLVVVAASLASLVGVGLILLKASDAKSGAAVAGMTALGVASVVLAWAMVHTVFTLRYASLYYYGEPGGIDFNEDEAPDYRDFAYLAFTIGMTYQVSDTNLQNKAIRRTALKHALLSFVFGTAIIAVTINVVAGLAH